MDSPFTADAVRTAVPARAGRRLLPPSLAYRLLLAVAIVLAFVFRAGGLATYGFSEDEAAKLRAIDAYRRGDFTANAEHPMLMKLAMWASLSAADRWNAAAQTTVVAPEAALRFPNVLAGTATVGTVYGAAHLLFGPVTALAAAFLVALDPNVTAINRIGKEDTLAIFFLMLGVCAYERAKVAGASEPGRAQRWYRCAAAAFGLMLGSKYIPWFFGFYAIFNYVAMPNPGANRPRQGPYYATLAAAFLAVDFAVLLPETWAYCLAYLRGEHRTHYGYPYAGTVYPNSSMSLAGVPLTYYVHLFAAKVPLPVLACAAAGLVPLVLKRGERGFIWLRVFLLLPLLCYSLFASKFQRYALPMLLMLDVLAAVGLASIVEGVQRRPWGNQWRQGLAAAVATAAGALLIAAQVGAAPFYSTFQNAIGAAAAPPVTAFPEEAYDFGVREAVAAIAGSAAAGASIASDAPMAVAHYLQRVNRTDIEARSLSAEGIAPRGDRWVIVQEGHRYFENTLTIDQLRRAYAPWREYRLAGTVVLQVFHLPGS